ISDMQDRYEDEKKQRKIELLQKEKEIRNLELQQLILQQEKQEKVFETRQRMQQIEALTREKELKETQLKIAQYEQERIQKEILSYQKDKEIIDLELKNRAMKIKTQNFTQKALLSLIALSIMFALFGFFLAYKISKTNKALNLANTKLEQIAKTDPLTDLSNRRDMIEKMEHEQKRFGRNGKSFVLLMSDIDDFKNINDDNGHDCGDFILESLARQMKSSARKQDITGRWGGEEFLMLLPETDIDGGVALADKIRKDIEATSYVFSEKKLELTMTFGVSVYDRPMDIDQCIKMADEALYRGKKQGKNCVVMTRPKDKPIIIGIDKSAESI
ncbi:MAG: GGDEF domain-containing protein, partial [Candidatus Cloacimonetes bacterium]|nr:GGDEF domain-containing protein [Candidatus Cloacimonadota bacterium]